MNTEDADATNIYEPRTRLWHFGVRLFGLSNSGCLANMLGCFEYVLGLSNIIELLAQLRTLRQKPHTTGARLHQPSRISHGL